MPQVKYSYIFKKKNSRNKVFFVDEKFNISSLKKDILKSEYLFIQDLLKSRNTKKNILSFDYNSKSKIILVSLKKDINSTEIENLGAKFFEHFKSFSQNEYTLNSDSISIKSKNLNGHFIHGLKLKSYEFDK